MAGSARVGRTSVHLAKGILRSAQFLTLRWGKVLEDLILEDTATWEAASGRSAAAGDIEAAGPPLTQARSEKGSFFHRTDPGACPGQARQPGLPRNTCPPGETQQA